MMGVARSILNLGIFLVVGSALALWYNHTPGTSGFVVSCIAIALGAAIAAAGVLIARWNLQRADQKEER